MRWRHRKRLLAALQGAFALALVPTFAVMAWSVGDGPAALTELGFGSPLPPLGLTNAFMAVPIVSLFLAMSRVARMVDSMRMLAIDGGTQIIPPARPPAPVDLTAFMLPVTLFWRPTRRRRIGMSFGFLISLAIWIGLAALVFGSGLPGQVAMSTDALFWLATGATLVVALLLALIPYLFLRAATQRPRGVVADDEGVAEWGRRRAIAWADARLLEIGSRRGATLYTLYAANGRSIAWTSRSNDPLYIGADKPDGSDMQDSPQLAAAILALAKAHAGLIPRTFDIRAADRASNLAAESNLPFGSKSLPGMWSGTVAMFLGITLGAGLATLSMRSPVTPALAQVCFATLAVSTLWSLALTVRDAMQTPRFLMSAERPGWRLPTGFSAGGVAQLQQSRVRWRNWGMATRAALLLVGAIAGLAVIIMALAVGYIAVSVFDAWAYLSWLVGVAIFGGLRVWGQFSADRVAFLADAHGLRGLRDLRSPASQPTPWPDIATLRFTWTRAAGYVFSASTQDGEEFSWVSQSRLWRDEPPDLAASGVQASAVDGDAFAAMVAAYTGLTPAQELG